MSSLRSFVLAAVTATVLAGAASLQAAPPSAPSPTVAEAEALIYKKDYKAAIGQLNDIVASDPRNADAFNYLGFAHRKLGSFAEAKKHYDKALSLDPKHKGAHEYIGELYLETGDLPNAEKHLATLTDLCPRGCQELDDLKKAVADYKVKKGS